MEASNLLGRIGRLTILLAQQFSWPPPTPRDALQGFVAGRTADPGRVQRRGQSLHPSAWHPFGWSADAELLQSAVECRYGQSRIRDRRSGLAETRAMARGFGSGIDPLRRGNYREAHSLEWVRPLLATIAPDELDLERLIVVVDGPKIGVAGIPSEDARSSHLPVERVGAESTLQLPKILGRAHPLELLAHFRQPIRQRDARRR